jgi:tRNA-2-methylthio-N6-dimethylallyladenosine synthase
MRTVAGTGPAPRRRDPALRYRVITYGCQMNERDSQAISALLENLGYSPAARDEPEDLVVFNTCCVRDNAERKITGKILEYRELKSTRPGLLVGVGGCMTQQPGAAERLARRAPWLDFIYGTHNLERLGALVAAAELRRRLQTETGNGSKGPLVEIDEAPGPVPGTQPRVRAPGVQAFVSVSYGCDNFCSYCIVPYVRGPERSRPLNTVVAEVVDLARSGIREITLLGQNVNSYGRDLPGGVDFAALLQAADKAGAAEGLARLRFLTSHPKDLTARLIEAMATLQTVCEHIHLPVQSGSNRVLQAMNRGYTREHYLELIRRLREPMPLVGLTTDIIVGFPGETVEDFEHTLDLVREAGFDSAFTFAFSSRRGTAAAGLADQVPPEVRRERLALLNRLQETISHERLAALGGTRQEVLFSEQSPKDPAVLGGRTRGFHYVLTPGPAELVGLLGCVEITRTRTWTVTGRLLRGEPHPDAWSGPR